MPTWDDVEAAFKRYKELLDAYQAEARRLRPTRGGSEPQADASGQELHALSELRKTRDEAHEAWNDLLRRYFAGE